MLLLAAISGASQAWEFPRLDVAAAAAPQQHPLLSPNKDDDVDIITGSQFNGLRTFANLPYVNCFSDDESEGRGYDIAILGAPFDTTTTGRPGARFGPGGIRTGSQRMFPQATSIYTGRSVLDSWATIVDCGDVGLTWLDNNVALRQLDKAHRVWPQPD